MTRYHKTLVEEVRRVVAGPVRIATPDGVVMELQRLMRSGKFSVAGLAKVALDMFERKKIDIMETNPGVPDVDTAILVLALANRNTAAVATVDRALRSILTKHRLKVIFPRGARGLMVS